MDRQWRKLILLISLLLIPSLLYAMPLWMVGGNSSTTSSDACSTCPSDSDGGDVTCEDFEGTGYLCSWTETTTNCTSGYPNEDVSHTGTLSCTNKGSQALAMNYNGTTGICHTIFNAGAAKTTGYIQSYINVIDTALSATGSIYVFIASDSSDLSNALFILRANYVSASTYALRIDYYNTSSGWSAITGSTLNEGTWYRVGIAYITDSGSIELFVDGASQGSGADLVNDRDPQYFGIGTTSAMRVGTSYQIDNFKFDDDTMPGACP